MRDFSAISYEEVLGDIYPEVLDPVDIDSQGVTLRPPDIYRHEICSLKIEFIMEERYVDGSYQRRAVSLSDLKRWSVSSSELCDEIVKQTLPLGPSEWELSYKSGKTYYDPQFTVHWTGYLFCPEEWLKLNIVGRPVLMIYRATEMTVSGDDDTCARRALKRVVKRVPRMNALPLTPVPIVHDGSAWREWK